MQVNSESDNDTLKSWERWLELVVLLMFGLLAFFLLHQSRGTGFFTSEFGPWEMLALYGPIFANFPAPLIRAATGRRNPARPFAAAAYLCLTVGSLWLLIRFPFDFTRLADVLPGSLRFLLAWFTDGLGRILLILQVIVSPINAVSSIGRYLSYQPHEPAPTLQRRSP